MAEANRGYWYWLSVAITSHQWLLTSINHQWLCIHRSLVPMDIDTDWWQWNTPPMTTDADQSPVTIYIHQLLAVRSQQWLLPPTAWLMEARSHHVVTVDTDHTCSEGNKPPMTICMDTDHCSRSVMKSKWPYEFFKATMHR